jgi:CRISPR-associated protein Cmr1
MNTILTARFCITTPMFLGGADPMKEAELRPASIKGALRFWWRALMWSRGLNSISDLRAKEIALFGGSEVGQSKVLLTLRFEQQSNLIPKDSVLNSEGDSSNKNVVGKGALYLGYGLMDAFDGKSTKAGRLTRPCIAAPLEFDMTVLFSPGTKEQDTQDVCDALKLFGLCGGLGSRSRRGYGSLTLKTLVGAEPWVAPRTIQEYIRALKCLFISKANHSDEMLPAWTAFAPSCSKVLLLQDDLVPPLEMLSKIGRDFVFFRSWGHNGRVLDEQREGNFKFDHDLMKLSARERNGHPKRIVFGLPQNYGKGPESKVEPDGFDRRASPLFFHIHQTSKEDAPLGILIFLPSRFLDIGNDKISVGGTSVPLATNGDGEFWQPVEQFLIRLKDGKGKVSFKHTHLEVIP